MLLLTSPIHNQFQRKSASRTISAHLAVCWMPSALSRAILVRLTPFTATEARFRPEEGRMYIFPAWLEHGVEVNRSDTDRVSISFNIHVARAGGR